VRTRRLLLVVLLAVPLVATGCRQDEKIESYEVPHPNREKIRLLAAILPYRDTTWFIRLSGPEAAVEEQRKPFDEFVKSIRFDEKEEPPIRWTAPEDWEQQKGKGMTAIVFRIPAKPHSLQATLTSLGKFDEGMNTLAGNINRWRKQIDLPPVEGPDLDKLVQHAMVDRHEFFTVDMTGVGVARRTGPAPANAGDPHAGLQMPPVGVPNFGTKGGSPKLPFRLEVPRGWQQQAKAAGISVASYEVVEGGARAVTTLTSMAGPAGGVLSNLKRWREDKPQAALPPASDAEIMKEAQELPVAGIKATYADFAGKNLRILGVILPLQGRTWFVKMTGPPDLVGRQKANFEAFVKSFKLDAE
jgi:hypothetical protein